VKVAWSIAVLLSGAFSADTAKTAIRRARCEQTTYPQCASLAAAGRRTPGARCVCAPNLPHRASRPFGAVCRVLDLDNIAAHPLSPSSARHVIEAENLLILAANPGDEKLFCGDLIAWCCARGRPPFVMALADGQEAAPGCSPEQCNDRANRRANDMLAALALLGLPPARVLLAGLACGKVPRKGPVFAAAVRAVRLVMWARDCNAILAPWPGLGRPDSEATSLIAAQVAIETGVAQLEYAAPKT